MLEVEERVRIILEHFLSVKMIRSWIVMCDHHSNTGRRLKVVTYQLQLLRKQLAAIVGSECTKDSESALKLRFPSNFSIRANNSGFQKP